MTITLQAEPGVETGVGHHTVDVSQHFWQILSMNGQTEVKPTSTRRVNRHRAGLMTYVRELRAEMAVIRHDLAMLVEAVRQSEQQQDHGR